MSWPSCRPPTAPPHTGLTCRPCLPPRGPWHAPRAQSPCLQAGGSRFASPRPCRWRPCSAPSSARPPRRCPPC
eukprot:scaffold26385_cov82-Phaeocystis_antarctica.AAC.3